MAKTQTSTTLITAGTSNAAAGTTRAILDVRAFDGGIVTMKLTNGTTGPTAAAEGRVLIAHNTSATAPTAASAGVDWKTVHRFNGGTAPNDGTTTNHITESHWRFGPEVTYIEVEIAGNTGQAVVCEASATTFVYA